MSLFTRIFCIPELDGEEDVELEIELLYSNAYQDGKQWFYDECWLKARRVDNDQLIVNYWPGQPYLRAKLARWILNLHENQWFGEYIAWRKEPLYDD